MAGHRGIRRVLAVAAVTALSLTGTVFASGPAMAGEPPQQVTLEDDVTFQSGGLTGACGLDVFITVKGTIHITLRTDRNGVLKEIDAFEDWAVTFSAPSTGESFSVKFGPAFFEYPDGAYIGAPSIVTVLGQDRPTPGAPASAGRTVLEGEVVFISPEGVPFVDFTGPIITQKGNQIEPAEATALICAELAG